MNKILLFSLCLLLAGIEQAYSQPSVTSGTGLIGYNLSSYGRLRVGAMPYTTASRQVDRMTFNMALSKQYVFDYYDDEDTTDYTARLITVPGIDSVSECMTDNGYSLAPPKVRAKHTVYAWKNTKYLITRFTGYNDSSATLSLYIGSVAIPRINSIYGGETVKYDSVKKVAYYFRQGTASYWGIKLLNKNPYSVKIYDWDNYSPTPDSDTAPDSVRYDMTAGAGFDLPIDAGTNGSIFNVNAGKYTLASKDSVQLYYAVVYDTTEAKMLAWADSAAAKYKTAFTSVHKLAHAAPTGYLLDQNYPNPFNPTTQIRFTIPERSQVILTVYDALGRQVETLVNSALDGGSYSTAFDASQLSSGIYYYTLIAGSFRETKGMVIMK
jgi:hypothetical protein